MDTKLKNIHRLAVLLIAISILLPATILVALYPRMEQEYLQQVEGEKQDDTGMANAWSDSTYEIAGNYINYMVEASYYIYSQLLQESTKKEVDTTVLDEYGWINDYYTISGDSDYYARYHTTLGSWVEQNSEYRIDKLLIDETGDSAKNSVLKQIENDGYVGYAVLKFDEYGKISNVHLQGIGNRVFFDQNVYESAANSVRQYKNNVAVYNMTLGEPVQTDVIIDEEAFEESALEENSDYLTIRPSGYVDAEKLQPKNFEIVFAIPEGSGFVYNYVQDNNLIPQYVYANMGAPVIIVMAALFVVLMAFILPFFKKLQTGYEKLFSLPVEIIWCIMGMAMGGIVLMFELMSVSSYRILEEFVTANGGVRFIGYDITPQMLYYTVLAFNYIGWAVCFLGVYISAAATRQFLCAPIQYTKEKCLFVRFLRWIKRGCVNLYRYVTDIEIGSGMKKSIVKLVIANFVIVFCLCCFWFAGIFGVIIYSVLLYILMLKYGSKLQKQYGNIVYVTKQMAAGNLKVKMEDELGIFAELGGELGRVQEGFAKAVAEEAKSQNMKTELITNVSHDLKTPLTAIITYVDLLKKEDITEEERREYIETLDKKSQRLKALIEDLFEVSKASTNNITMYCTDIDLVNLLKQVYLENEDKIAESTLDVRLSLPEKKCIAYLDPNRTYRIMDNLLQNALKYSMPHSRVYLEMEEVETEYVIRFKNMSATEMNFDASEITERFVRGDLSRNTEGSGLGLAIAQSFTELQNGKFSIEIDGDLFKVTLRFAKRSAE